LKSIIDIPISIHLGEISTPKVHVKELFWVSVQSSIKRVIKVHYEVRKL